MARRRSDDMCTVLWDLFIVTPWWVCPITAVVAYLILAYALPSLLETSPFLKHFSSIPRLFAPWSIVVILFIGLAAGLRRWSSGFLLDRQRGPDTINALTWREFEELIAAAYRRQGYRVVETGGGGADGGVDLILHRDGERVLVQCKHWRSAQVGVKLIRELHGLKHSKEHAGSRGAFVTFGEYTQEAKRFAQQNDIELVDRKSLLEMIESARRMRSAEGISDVVDESSPCCPLCGSPMLIRTAKRGNQVGSKFWGCNRYPGCRGTRAC